MASTGRRFEPVALLLLFVVAAGLVAGIVIVAANAGENTPAGRTITITIPAGTFERVRAGEDPGLLASVVEFRVGDTLVVVNDDDVPHALPGIAVGPGRTERIALAGASRQVGDTTLRPDRLVTMIVRDVSATTSTVPGQSTTTLVTN